MLIETLLLLMIVINLVLLVRVRNWFHAELEALKAQHATSCWCSKNASPSVRERKCKLN